MEKSTFIHDLNTRPLNNMKFKAQDFHNNIYEGCF